MPPELLAGVCWIEVGGREQSFRIRYYASRYRGDGIPRILT